MRLVFSYPFKNGHGLYSRCGIQLELTPAPERKALVTISDCDDNPGGNWNDVIEHLANALKHDHLANYEHHEITWVERKAGSEYRPDRWSQVCFDVEGGKYVRPVWVPIQGPMRGAA